MNEPQSASSVHQITDENLLDPAFVANLQQSAKLANENCDRAVALAHKLSGQLREAHDRINQLELEADGLMDRLRAEAKSVVAELQSDAHARIDRTKREADERIERGGRGRESSSSFAGGARTGPAAS
jgi:DNA anti-recombination protein RmuC